MEENRESDEIEVPEDAVEDLEPDAEDATGVKGGVYQWWQKVEEPGPDGR